MGYDQVKAGKDVPNDINVIIEISAQGDPIKFEVDKDSGAVFVDRFMGTSMRYPINYGYVPHTIAVCWALDMRISWVGKSSLFRWPFVGFLKWMGGIPVIRDQKLSQVQRMAETLKREKKMFLVISPPGTRTKMDHWKSGFYHISQAAQVPVLCGFLDWGKKQGGIGPLVTPTGNMKADMVLDKSR